MTTINKIVEEIKQYNFCHGLDQLRLGASEPTVIEWFTHYHEAASHMDLDERGHLPVLFHWTGDCDILFTPEGVFEPSFKTIVGKRGRYSFFKMRKLGLSKLERIANDNPEFSEEISMDWNLVLWRIKNNPRTPQDNSQS